MNLDRLYDPDNRINRFCDMLIGVFLTGLFTVLCSIPIVTMSTSITAGYYAMAKCVRHNEGYVWREFFRAFKMNFKSAFPLGLGYLIAVLVIVFDYMYLKDGTDSFSSIMVLILVTIAAMLVMTFFFVFFELSRFSRSRFDSFKFGVVTAFRHFPSSIAIALIFAVSLVLVYLMPWGFCLFPGFALYGSTFLMERVMRKYMPVPEEDSEEAQKWYYR